MQPYFVGLDVHKQLIAFCVKTADGEIVAEGTIAATRAALNEWKHKRGQTHFSMRVQVTSARHAAKR